MDCGYRAFSEIDHSTFVQGVNRWIIGTGTVSLVLVFVMLGYFPVRLQRESLKPGSVILGLFYIGLVAAAFVAVIVALRVSVYSGLLREAANLTMIMTSMIFVTILAASFFSLVFIGLGGEERVMGILERLPGGVTGALAFTMIFVFVLVFFGFR